MKSSSNGMGYRETRITDNLLWREIGTYTSINLVLLVL